MVRQDLMTEIDDLFDKFHDNEIKGIEELNAAVRRAVNDFLNELKHDVENINKELRDLTS